MNVEQITNFWSGASIAPSLFLAEGGGFGLNTNFLETNLFNLAVVIGVLVYFGRGFLGKLLGTRRSNIEAAIRDAEERQKAAKLALDEQQAKLAQAQQESERIRANAVQAAEKTKAEILAKSERDVQRMREDASRDLAIEQDRAIAELRQRAVTMAISRVESTLSTSLDDDKQRQSIDRGLALVGGK
jgi:F-type H+-transporting ATPase subunit b